jgi:hypothetical protein
MTKQERTIVNEAEEEAKKNRKKILGIFPRSTKKSGSQPGSGAATPSDTTPPRQQSGDYEYDDDDLPPREGDIGELNHPNQSNDSVNTEDESVRGISKTAGFDFKAISKELGKEIDVDRLPARPEDVQPRVVPIVKVDDKPPLERSGSAPPLSIATEEATEDTRPITSARSTTVLSPMSFGEDGDDDDIGDIAGSTRQLSIHSSSTLELPSWGQAATSPTRISPPIPSPTSKPSSFAYNAWLQPPSSSATFAPARAAPPARPHPAEFLANPFAAGEQEREVDKKESTFNFGLGGWGKKTNEDPWSSGKKGKRMEEEQNPW